ncbi:MAG: cupin domain-containing protein [Myxococcales bacterium]|nr:cupin domain-containing protein [Myxococcales bacterium]
MQPITILRADEIEAYSGPHEIPGIKFRTARQALGVTSWGMNVLSLDAHCDGYPEHDHQSEAHEEVYVVLRGSVVLQARGEEHVLEAGQMVRVAPEVKRKLVTRDEAALVLALGGTPGKAYEAAMGSGSSD